MLRLAYKNYLLIVLLAICAFNYVDRQALALVLQNIKADLALTDTQLGLLTGIAFALFYSIMGIPIARWADRGNRVVIIAVTTAVWSVAVALCGLAGNFLQLMLMRSAVGVGEAGCMPPAQSLLGTYFTREERPRAFAIYMSGWSFSALIGYFLAGWMSELYGWRLMFALLGLPGLVLAGIAWFTLRDPRVPQDQSTSKLDGTQVVAASDSPPMSFRSVCLVLWGNSTFRHLLLCLSVSYFLGAGIMQWQPTFFVRSYALETGKLGTWFAVVYGFGSLIGTYLGGEWASRYAARNESLQLRTMAGVFVAFGLVQSAIYLSPSADCAFACMGVAAIGINLVNGPLFALVQTLVQDRMRAMSIALIYLSANFIGMGLGPLAAGMLSDALRPWAGDESLRYALLALCPGFLWCGWHLWQGSKTVTRDIESMQDDRLGLPLA